MDQQRAKASCQIRGPGFGRTIGHGELVDLDARLGGQPMRELINPDWFEPVADPAARRPRARRTETDEES